MSSKKPSDSQSPRPDDDAADRVRAGGWSQKRSKPLRRAFAGPVGAGEPLRLNLSREAYAELGAHGKSQLNTEVCGVLLGHNCVDDEGEHVTVDGIIRGEAARQGGTHVTFTQETWSRIHDALERDYPDLDIVGWYHTHPGFGVEFSDMDLFIQRNFFAGANQIAFLLDPLGGEEAVCFNGVGGIRHLTRFWVDGRERRCRHPVAAAAGGATLDVGISADLAAALRGLEDRLGQTMRLIDDQRAAQYRLVATLGLICAFAFIAFMGYGIYRQVTLEYHPPERLRYAEIPVQVGDETFLVGVDVVKWQMPQVMADRYVQAVQRLLAAEEAARLKAAEEAAKPAGTSDAGKHTPPAPSGAAPAASPSNR